MKIVKNCFQNWSLQNVHICSLAEKFPIYRYEHLPDKK